MSTVLFVCGLRFGPRTVHRTGIRAKHDLPEPHRHTGPVAVDAEYQGLGIGTALITRFCAEEDAAGEVAYLETHQPLTVRF